MSTITTQLGNLIIESGPLAEPEPVNLIPQSISRAQGKTVLIMNGMWGGVEQFVATIPDPIERALAEVALHDTQEWRRESQFLTAAAAALGLSNEQLDALFVTASEIEL